MKKKKGIFAFYDKDGIVDDYVLVYLSAMRKILDEIIVVSNGEINISGKKEISKYVTRIVERDNKGFDAAAYKDVILNCNHYLDDADELVLFNDTVFGPLYPLEDLFLEMRSRGDDFWGITRHENAVAWGINVPPCVQSYFIVIEGRMLHSRDFNDFWMNQSSEAQRLEDVVLNFEFAFTDFFSKKGYSWDTFVDYSELDSSEPKCNFSPTYYANYELIKYKHYPFIKRKNFSFHDGFRLCNGEDIVKCYNYVADNKLYDTKLIWKNILRIYNILDIYASMHLTYVVTKENVEKSAEAASLVVQIQNDITARYFVERVVEVKECFENIYVIDTPFARKQFDNCGIEKIVFLRSTKVLEALEDDRSELFCIVSDVPHDETDKLYSKSATYINIDNVISSVNEVENSKRLFDKNESLGALFTPDSYIGIHCNTAGGVWNKRKFDRLENVREAIGLKYPVKMHISQISNSNALWCRKSALCNYLDKLNQIKRLNIFDAIRLFPYIAADNYYYTGTILSAEQAGVEYVNYRMIFGNFVGPFRDEKVSLDFPLGYMRGITQLMDFCESCDSIYIFGAGDFAQRTYSVLCNSPVVINGFVVTNPVANPKHYCGLPVVGIADMHVSDKIGVVIGLSAEKQKKVKTLLTKCGVKKIYRL